MNNVLLIDACNMTLFVLKLECGILLTIERYRSKFIYLVFFCVFYTSDILCFNREQMQYISTKVNERVVVPVVCFVINHAKFNKILNKFIY